MNDLNNQPVANGLPASVSPINQTPSRRATTGQPPTIPTAPADLPQHELQSTGPRLNPAPVTSEQARVFEQPASTAAATPIQTGAGDSPASVPHATPPLRDPVPSRQLIPPIDGVVPRAADIAPTLDLSLSPTRQASIAVPTQRGMAAPRAPTALAPAAVTVSTKGDPGGSSTLKPLVYGVGDLDRIAADVKAARKTVAGLNEVRSLQDFTNDMLQRDLTLIEIHGLHVSRHGLKVDYKRFLALLSMIRKQPG